MRTIVLGDVHLGSPLCRTSLLSQVIEHVPFDRLVLNGDVFDDLNFRRLKDGHWRVLDLFREVAQDRELIWVCGNHDGSPEALHRLLGVDVVMEYRFAFKGNDVLVLHGHQFDRFHKVTRSLNTLRGAFYGFALWFDVPRKTAIQWFQRSTTIFDRASKRVNDLAVERAREEGASFLVLGHTHHRETALHGGVTLFNPSSWLTPQPAYVLFDEEETEPELVVVGRRSRRSLDEALRTRVRVTGRRVARRKR